MSLRKLVPVASNTMTECIRQPIYLVVLLVGTGLLAINPALAAFTLGDDNKLLADVGLSTLFLSGVVLAAFSSTAVLSEEIRRKTVLTVVSKPVSRPLLIVGKYLGTLGAVWLAVWVWSLTFLLSLRHGVMMTVRDPYHAPVIILGFSALFASLLFAMFGNYLRRWVFASTFTASLAVLLPIATVPAFCFDPSWNPVPITEQFDPAVLMALLLAAEALAVMCAVAIAASTRLAIMLTLTVCALVFTVGLTSESILGRFASDSLWARAAYTMTPNLQSLWLGDAIVQEQLPQSNYLLMASGYAISYVVAILGIAVFLFQSRDVG